MPRSRRVSALLATALVGFALIPIAVPPAGAQRSARSPGDPVDIALDHVREAAPDLGVRRADVTDMVVASSYSSAHNGVTHVNLNQRHDGLEVFGSYATVNVAADGDVLFVGDSLVKNLAAGASGAARLDATAAVASAADALDLKKPKNLRVLSRRAGAAKETVVSPGGISAEPIPARLGWQPTANGLRLSWQMVIDDSTDSHLWNATIDASTGELLAKDDWTDRHTAAELATTLTRAEGSAPAAAPDAVDDGSSYRVFALLKESPNDGGRTLVANPADDVASPFGWHDTDGAPGEEFTTTQGNNVHAYTDRDANNIPDPASDPDGGENLDFDFPADLNEHPQTYTDAAVSNLYYWNNVVHDVTYRYGFDEASGNFQVDNYGRGGAGGDYVRAEAADGSGENNANFSTPAVDGTGEPRMQMFLWPGLQFGLPNAVTIDTGPAAGTYEANFARFTPAPTTAGISGDIAVVDDGSANPTQGCDPLIGFPAGAIALVDSGGCAADVKVRNAEAAGGAGLIVANNFTNPPNVMSGSMDPPVGIPAVMVSQADGNTIKSGLPAAGSVHRNTDRPPMRDGDLESGIIIHEYGHGVSNRLTGGPTVNCLFGDESMSEGWSDYLAIAMLLDPNLDDPEGPRGLGPYALFQASRGDAGIRPAPYSRNMENQPATYDSIKTAGWLEAQSLSVPHGVGHAWAAMLWDMTWDLIDVHGFNPNVYEPWGTGGNNLAIQLVMDGLKFQGCSPGFVVGRDAIIAADQALTGGANACTLWASFARRGLGFGATQGSPFDRNDNFEAFDTHPDCLEGFFGGVVDEPALNDIRAGANVPLVFSLGGDKGLDIFASGSPYSRQVDCETLKTIDPESRTITPRPLPIATQTPGKSGLTYDPAEDRYTYPWKSLKDWADTCREIVLTRTDGIQHRAYFRFGPSEPPAPSPVLQRWQARYNGAGNGSDFAQAAVLSPDGSRVFVTGQSLGDGTGFDYATVAYDAASGEQLWESRFNGPPGDGHDVAWDLEVSPDGDRIFVTGQSIGLGTGLDYATVAYDATSGEQLWAARNNGPGNGFDIARSVAVSPDGARVFVTGQNLGDGTSLDYVTVAYDSATGEELWLARYNGPFPGGTGTDDADEVVASPNGSQVFVTGRSSGVSSGGDYTTVAYDAATGTEQWVARYNGPGNRTDEPHALAIAPDGERLYVTGRSLGADSFLPDYTTVAYDTASGNELWVARHGSPDGSDVARAVTVDPADERVFVTGSSFTGDVTGLDYGTIAYDAASGEEIWSAQFNGPANAVDAAWALGLDSTGSRLVVTGQSLDLGTFFPDYATVSYDATNGSEQWVTRYGGPGLGIDIPRWVGLSPNGTRVFVTGGSAGQGTRDDYATVGYEIVPLEE
jgi:extracellular elastinolytic metalloproteinase